MKLLLAAAAVDTASAAAPTPHPMVKGEGRDNYGSEFSVARCAGAYAKLHFSGDFAIEKQLPREKSAQINYFMNSCPIFK